MIRGILSFAVLSKVHRGSSGRNKIRRFGAVRLTNWRDYFMLTAGMAEPHEQRSVTSYG